MQQPRWLEPAWAELGQAEAAGSADNPRVVTFFRDAGFPGITDDETAWCAAFVGACLARAGLPGSGSLLARSYGAYGDPIAEGRLGAIVVLSRGSDPSLGHVGFWLGETEGRIVLLGGNQGDSVTVEAFDRTRLVAMRWPADAPGARPSQHDEEASLFEHALAHVLRMEGGYTDDPVDPGGPTNKGITLATFAAWRNEVVSGSNRAGLVADLKTIDDDTVRRIYAARYWVPSRSPQLPPALAIMHFDAAVNHGVAGAARMLQTALEVAADGEIGPLTMAAARSRAVHVSVARYAEIRRKRYRALPHFWRFGRGWLARVDKTLALALAHAGAAAALPASATEQGAIPMSDTNTPEPPNSKWWGHSLTIWGVIVTGLSTVLPVVGPLIGIDISGEVVRQIGAQATQVIQAIGGLVGTLMTVYGRTRAALPLTRRDVTLQL